MTYHDLVVKRKEYIFTIPGLVNQSSLAYDDGDFLDPWAKWQNSISPEILVIGQDWGNVKYYESNNGFDDPANPTCKNLMELFDSIGFNIGTPTSPIEGNNLHFANIISFLRTGNMQGGLPLILNQTKINEFAALFIQPLIEVVRPKIIITLGLASYHAILSIFGTTDIKTRTLKSLISNEPILLTDGILLFPMYHCGASVVNRNRSIKDQKSDWVKIKKYL